MRRTAVVLSLVASFVATATAEPITVVLGAGMRVQRTAKSTMTINGIALPEEPGRTDVGPGLSLALGYRLPASGRTQVALGVRAAFARMEWEDRDYGSYGYDWADVTRRYPLDLALSAQVVSGRWWATPWLGLQQTRITRTTYDVPVGEPTPSSGGRELSSVDERALSGGISVGYDLLRSRAGSLGLAIDGEATSRYAAIGLGLAYRL